MSSYEQWAQALSQQPEHFTLQFQRLGLEAECRPLRSEEVEECRRMGGERGLRYALYLSCDALRQAGEQMKRQGALALSFDITQRLAYGDILAAGGAILEKSGAGNAQVRLLGRSENAQEEALTLHSGGESFWQNADAEEQQAQEETNALFGEYFSHTRKKQLISSGEDAQSEDTLLALARVFAQRLASASANS